MKLYTTYRYQLRECRKHLIIFYVIVLLCFLPFLLLMVSTMDYSHSESPNIVTDRAANVSLKPEFHQVVVRGHQSFGGIEFLNVIALVFFGYYTFRTSFQFLVQSGVSRRTILIAQGLSSLTLIGIIAVINNIFLVIGKQWAKHLTATYCPTEYYSLFEVTHSDTTHQMGSTSLFINNFFFNLFLFSFVMFAFYLISLIYYRINRTIKFVLNLFLFSYVIILHNLFNYVLSGRLNFFYHGFYNNFFLEPLRAMLSFLFLTIACAMLSYVLIRKTPIRGV